MKWIFCPHHAEPTGATVALKRLLIDAPVQHDDCLIVFPSPSPLEPEMRDYGFAVRTLNVQQQSLSTADLFTKIALLWNRIASLWSYYRVFRSDKRATVFVNSSVQIAPMIAAKIAGRRLIVKVHEGWTESITFGLKRRVINLCANKVIFDSHTGMSLFKIREDIPQHVQPNSEHCIDADRVLLRRDILSELNLPPQTEPVIFLGTPCKRKGFPDLIEVWKKVSPEFPGHYLLVAGKVEPTEPSQEIDDIHHGLIPNAKYLGYRRDTQRLIAGSSFLVLPSYGEAMPLVITEAMHIGTPVIARNVADVGWQIGEGRGFLFEGDGPEPLEAMMREAFTLPAEADDRAARAKEFARTYLNSAIERDKLWAFLLSY